MFKFPDAANIFSNNINVSHENVQMTEVKNESDDFNFAEEFTINLKCSNIVTCPETLRIQICLLFRQYFVI